MTIIKYVGSKLQFVDTITRKMPPKHGLNTFGDYYEPFLGSAAIALNMITGDRTSYLSDISPELINMWLCVQRNPRKLFNAVMAIDSPKCGEDYLAVRTAYNKAKCRGLVDGMTNGIKWLESLSSEDAYTIAAQYIWLNKTKFNGLERVNQKGESNVSWNKNLKPSFPPLSQLKRASYTLRNAHITCQSFTTALENVKPNDLVYCDPPYDLTFAGYTADRFQWESQYYLSKLLEDLANKGVHVFTSNSDTDYVRSLYKDWDISVLQRKGTVSCKGSNRGKVAELLMTRKFEMEGAIA
jgi:DNA adenine methylase